MDGPYLRIVEQPESTTRLRYESEKKHGFLLGANSPPGAAKSDKTYPKVELVNHSSKAKARIEVRLCQEAPCDDLHPADEGLKARSRLVPQRGGSNVVSFENIKINLLKNNEVTNWLMKTTRKTYEQCKPLEESINKYAVRLRFSAHHPNTDAMICPPVYSTTVKHCKEKLTVVNYMKFRGSPKGGQPFWILVEGINIKKNIRVVFYEEMPDGSRDEFAEVPLNDTHFHHMHAITTETPPYRTEMITETKQVQFLLRDVTDPGDPRESESRTYEYCPDKVPISEGRSHSDSISSSSTGYSSSTQTDTLPKIRRRQTSSSLCRKCRRQLSSYAGSVSEVVDLTSESSEDVLDDTVYPNDDYMQPTEFDISLDLDHLENVDVPIEPSEQYDQQNVFPNEMFTKDDYQSTSYEQPMKSFANPVLGEVNMMNNNEQSEHQSFCDVDMDVDNFIMEAMQGELKWVSDSAKPQKMHKKNDWINRYQIENTKLIDNTIYKTAPSQHTGQVKVEMCNTNQQCTQLEVHDVVFQYDSDAAAAGSSGEEYETAEESEEQIVSQLQVLKMNKYVM